MTTSIQSIFALLFSLKLLWMFTYFSTDFDVHRNWMAITANLPSRSWYYEDTSEWTLDYPPLFAYFELILASVMRLVDPSALVLTSGTVHSNELIVFQRMSVIISELLYYYGTFKISKIYKNKMIVVLLLTNPGLLLVDHIHFQYNSMLYGMELLSFAALMEGNGLKAGIWFAIVLCFKHIYLYHALAYFVYLLGGYCFVNHKFELLRFFKLGISVVFVFVSAFGPFYKHIPQILSRLFPFGRGLTHAYWAPNFWALYSFVDRVLVKVMSINSPSLTRGLIGDVEFGCLPTPTASTTAILTLIFQIPILVRLWYIPTPTNFTFAVTLTGYASFMFGYHVHEKAILMVLIPLALTTANTDKRFMKCFAIASVSGIFSLFPLVYKDTEQVTKVVLLMMYMTYINQYVVYTWLEKMYVIGFAGLYIYMTFIHFWVFGSGYEFLPLLFCSVYSSLGITTTFLKLYLLSLAQ